MRADTDKNPFETLKAAIAAVMAWFEASAVRGVIIGGVANAFLGRPRATRDVDGMVVLDNDSQIVSFVIKGAEHGIVPRIPDAIAFARSYRVLLLCHTPSGIEVDISCGCMPFESEVLDRSIVDGMLGFDVRLATPEDLIVMKAVANRPHDWRDIEGLIDAHPDLDSDRVLLWSRRFAEIMDSPEIIDQLEKLLQTARSKENPSVTPRRSTKKAVELKASPSNRVPKKNASKKTATRSRKKPLQD